MWGYYGNQNQQKTIINARHKVKPSSKRASKTCYTTPMSRRWLFPFLIFMLGLAIRLVNFYPLLKADVVTSAMLGSVQASPGPKVTQYQEMSRNQQVAQNSPARHIMPAVPSSLYWDEMAIVNDALCVAATGRDIHDRHWLQSLFISYGDYKLPVYIWLSSMVAQFSSNPFLIARTPSFLAGISMFGAAAVFTWFWPWQSVFFVKNSVTEKNTKIVQRYQLLAATLFVLATMPWSIHFSRVGFEGHVATALVWWSAALAVYGWSHFSKNRGATSNSHFLHQFRINSISFVISIWPLLVATLLGSLAVYTYFSVRFVWPIIFVLTAILFSSYARSTNLRSAKELSTNKRSTHQRSTHQRSTKELSTQSLSANTRLAQAQTVSKLLTAIIGHIGHPLLTRAFLTLVLIGIWILTLLPMWRADFYQASQQFRLSTPSVLNLPEMQPRIQAQRTMVPAFVLAGYDFNHFTARLAFNRATYILRPLAQNILRHLDPSFLFLRGDHNLRHGIGYTGIMFLWMAPMWLIGMVRTWRHEPRLALLLSVWWLAGTLPAAVPLDGPHALRALNTLPVHVMFTALGLHHTYLITREKISHSKAKYVMCILALIPAGAIFTWMYTNQTVYKVQAAAEWQDGYLPVARYIADQHDEYARVTVDEFDERFFLYYQPYSGLTWQEIQHLPSQDFTRAQFGNVTIKNFTDWHDLEQGVLYVVSAAQFPPQMNGKIKDTIYGSNGQPLFFSLVANE